MTRIFLVFVVSLFVSVGFSRNTPIFQKVSNHIVAGDLDSAYLLLPRVEEKEKAILIAKLISQTASYMDFCRFIQLQSISSRSEWQRLVDFLEKKIIAPKQIDSVNLDYVKIELDLIEIHANKLELEDATIRHDQLKTYLKQIRKKTGKTFRLAQLHVERFDALLIIVESEFGALEQIKPKIKEALDLNDKYLSLVYANIYSETFKIREDVEGFNRFYLERLDLIRSFKGRNDIYENCIENLVDGLMFARYADNDLIQELLFELYNSPTYHYASYYSFLRYLLNVFDDKTETDKILSKLGYTSIHGMLLDIEKRVPEHLTNNELGFFYTEAARMYYTLGLYEDCMKTMYALVLNTKDTYSNELSNVIADTKIREAEKSQQLIIDQEKEKNTMYLFFAFVVSSIFLFTLVLAARLASRSSVLKEKVNENAKLLEEKDVLMKEINHRVKNNFSLVSALLDLQANETTDLDAIELLSEGKSRIQSLSLIHEKLSIINHSTSVSIQEYIFELADLILRTSKLEGKVRLNVQGSNIHLDVDTAIPIGLILNELITNSCKHAFVGKGEWELHISLYLEKSGNYKLDYEEKGIKAGHIVLRDVSKKQGMGKLLVRSLIKQLHGRLEFSLGQGAHYEIWFKDKIQRKNLD